MQLDQLNTFAEATATGNTGTTPIGRSVDLGIARDIGIGTVPLKISAFVDTTITSANAAATYELQFVTADNEALSSNPVVLATSGAVTIGAGGIAKGTVLLNQVIPENTTGKAYKRYIGVREVVVTANTSAGKVNAMLVPLVTNAPMYQSI